MINSLNKLPVTYQGLIYIGVGVLVILYAFGLIQKGVNAVVITVATYAIIVGCTKLGLIKNHKIQLK